MLLIIKENLSSLKNIYIDILDDIANKYNNTYHGTIKMKPVDAKSSIYYIDSSKEVNDENPKFKIGNIARISKYKNIFAKGYVLNCSEEVFVIKKVQNSVTWRYVITDLKGEEFFRTFNEKELERSNRKEFRVEK